MNLLGYELRMILRHPVWWVLVAASWVTAFFGFSLAGWTSVGEWGRQLLGVVRYFFAALSGLLIVPAVFPELRHQGELWSTSRAAIPRIVMKFLAATLAALLAAASGIILTLPLKLPWGSFTWSGWGYLPVYLLLAALALALWISAGFFVAYLTRSRLLTVAVPAILWALLPTLLLVPLLSQNRLLSSYSVLIVRFLHPSAATDVTPLAPWGLTPELLFWGRLANVGFILLFLTGALWALRYHYAWRGLIRRSTLGLLFALVLLFVGGGAYGALQAGERAVASYTVFALLSGKVKPEGPPPALDVRGMPLALYGEYSTLYYPPKEPLPEWVETREREGGVQVIRLDEFVLLYPPDRTYSAELVGAVRQVEKLFSRARLWLQGADRVIVLPGRFDFSENPEKTWGFAGKLDFYTPNSGLAISEDLLRSGLTARGRWGTAFLLAKASGFHQMGQIYLALYMLKELDPEGVRRVLELIQQMVDTERPEVRTAEYLYQEPYKAGTELKKIPSLWIEIEHEGPGHKISNEEFDKATERKWPGLLRLQEALHQVYSPLVSVTNPYAAWLVLQYWQRGEQMGHEAFIQAMVAEAKGHANEK